MVAQSYLPGEGLSWLRGLFSLMFFTLPIRVVYMKQAQSSVLSPTDPVSSLEPFPLLLCFLSSARLDIMVQVPCKPDHPATQPAGLGVLALQNHVPCSFHLAISIMPQFPASVAPCSQLHLLRHIYTLIMSHPQTSVRSGKLFGQGEVPSAFDCLLLGVHSQLSPDSLHLPGLWDPCFLLSLLLAALGFILSLSTSVTNL